MEGKQSFIFNTVPKVGSELKLTEHARSRVLYIIGFLFTLYNSIWLTEHKCPRLMSVFIPKR